MKSFDRVPKNHLYWINVPHPPQKKKTGGQAQATPLYSVLPLNMATSFDGEMMRYAEYRPKETSSSDAEIDKRMGGALIAVGLGVAAAGFAGRYAFQLWKPLGQMLSETVRKMPTPAFSSYYKGGFEQKMSKREASLVLGISPVSTKAKVREAHRRIMVLNHPDKGGSPYLAAKINEAKDLLDKDMQR
ncbi:dnaJ homolog subfamily C member 15 isoform X2 [Syngnathoides biaculeatus]|uniref:dnaJ homolog subfamily C member 15 isoform X2 n=1 Tax=Syngnathoides biaculeatus TaxID=300417 RepID=UPI002ADE3B06|nr:dnaJ homolog subfamily C member 15 isoform X2 [Syngnathoides biaculeatus]